MSILLLALAAGRSGERMVARQGSHGLRAVGRGMSPFLGGMANKLQKKRRKTCDIRFLLFFATKLRLLQP